MATKFSSLRHLRHVNTTPIAKRVCAPPPSLFALPAAAAPPRIFGVGCCNSILVGLPHDIEPGLPGPRRMSCTTRLLGTMAGHFAPSLMTPSSTRCLSPKQSTSHCSRLRESPDLVSSAMRLLLMPRSQRVFEM